MNLGELLGRADLKEKFVLQKLLCLYLSCSREELWTSIDKELSDEVIQKVLTAYKAYVEDKKPLEYVLGHVDFFGKEFFVNEATLIPRPETEYMITAVTEFIKSSTLKGAPSFKIKEDKIVDKNNLLLDIGTGCGVLGISVLLQNPGYFAEAVFTDYFADALEVAKKNYENFKGEIMHDRLKVQFLHADLLDFLNDKSSGSPSLATSFLLYRIPFGFKEDFSGNVILVANLPYIPEEAFEQNSGDNVKKREPKPAFVGGKDGLDYYRIMLKQILVLRHKYQDIRPNQQNLDTGYSLLITMFLEMMTWQVDILRQEFGEHFVFEEVKTFHFNIRIVKAYLK